MEIHRSSLIYSPHNKSPQPVGKIQRAEKKPPQKTKQSIEVTFTKNNNSSKADLTSTYTEQALKQGNTKSAHPSLQLDTITNQSIDIRTQKALIAYNTEQNQIAKDNVAQIVSSVDYIV